MHEKIHERALAAALGYQKAEADLIDSLIEVEKERVFAKLGYSSLFVYAVRALKLSEAVAYNAITVARKSRKVPALREEVARGTISISKARKIAPVLSAAKPEVWLEKAKTLSSRELEKEVARENPKLATKEHTAYVTGKRMSLTLGMDEELMLRLRRAQDQVSRSKNRAASLEDTLKEILDFYLSRKDPLERAKRVTAKKGASIQLVPGRVQGQDSRAPIPAGLQHAIRLRDQGRCQAPSCTERRWVDFHHLKPVAEGGSHSLDNLLTLCKTHHQQAHQSI